VQKYIKKNMSATATLCALSMLDKNTNRALSITENFKSKDHPFSIDFRRQILRIQSG